MNLPYTFLRIFLGVFLWSIAYSVASAEVASNPLPFPPSWRIVYKNYSDLWAMRSDGSNKHLLVRDAASPALSQDRRKLAFVRRGNVWIANADGSRARQVTHWTYVDSEFTHVGEIHGISWHPSGLSLAVSRAESIPLPPEFKATPYSYLDIATLYEVPLTGAKKPKILFGIASQGTSFAFSHYEYPSWSPDGIHLALIINGEPWVARKNGPTTTTENEPMPGTPAWDLTRLAAVADFNNPNWRKSHWNILATGISWSSDGKQLAYCRQRYLGRGFAEIHLLTFAPGDKTTVAKDILLTGTDDVVSAPCFAPTGSFLLAWKDDKHRGLFAFSTRTPQAHRVFYDINQYTNAVW